MAGHVAVPPAARRRRSARRSTVLEKTESGRAGFTGKGIFFGTAECSTEGSFVGRTESFHPEVYEKTNEYNSNGN
jgi:hypothetical protein